MPPVFTSQEHMANDFARRTARWVKGMCTRTVSRASQRRYRHLPDYLLITTDTGRYGDVAQVRCDRDIFCAPRPPDGEELPIASSGAAETIETFGDGAHAILVQSVGGGGGIAGDANGGVPIVPEAISYGLNALFGRGGGCSGDGGAVTVRSRGPIVTRGDEAIGILAQSVGCGGGIGGNILAVDLPVVGTLFELGKHYGSVGGDGSGGTVTVDQVRHRN